MKPNKHNQIFSATAEMELVSKIQNEIKERESMAADIRQLSTKVPRDPLIMMAGELSLYTSPQGVSIYQQALWPTIRACIPDPDQLTTGTYVSVMEKTRAAHKALTPEPEENRRVLAAAQSPVRKDRDHPGVPVEKLLYELFVQRLDTGFFLSGIETLWGQTAPSLIRSIYHKCGLAQWDQLLDEYGPILARHAPFLHELLSGSSGRLNTPHFHVLLKLAGKATHPGMTRIHADMDFVQDHTAIRPWQWFAVDDFFKMVFPDEVESNDLQILYDDNRFCLKVLYTDGSWYQVHFSDEFQNDVKIDYPKLSNDKHNFKGIYLFDVVSGPVGQEPDDDETLFIQFVGQISKETLVQYHPTPTAGDILHIDKSYASPRFR